MRVIKFRIWDIKGNEWVYPDGLRKVYESIDLTLTEEGNMYFLGGKRIREDEYDVMQFTGLYDKNHKEIYANDIIKYSNTIKIVKWYQYKAGFYLFNKDDKLSSLHFHEEDAIDFIEIVGNIYENMELIK